MEPALHPQRRLLELVDSHAHLDMSEFDADREAVLARAQAAGVRNILAIGGASRRARLRRCPSPSVRLDLRRRRNSSARSEARHATRITKTLARSGPASPLPGLGRDRPRLSLRPFAARRAAARLHRTVGVGAPRATPRDPALPRGLARLPRHSRRATGAARAWAESFTASPARSRKRAAESKWVSWSPSPATCTYPKAQNLRDVAAALPLESLLIETDSPISGPAAPSRTAKRARLSSPR